jgi:hypothetical protein
MLRGSLRETVGLAKRTLQDGTEVVNPFVGPPLAHAKEGGDDRLEGRDLVGEQHEQSRIFHRQQLRFATTPRAALATLLVAIMLRYIRLPGLSKKDQERVKLLRLQAGQGAQDAWILFEGMIGEYRAPCRKIG